MPILACHEAKGNVKELFPTIYALLKVPNLVPTSFFLKTGVESYITNGADLMWPGVDRVEYSPEISEKDEEDSKGIG
jgi:predicted ribosome-associated RNA-binding protein Tma20